MTDSSRPSPWRDGLLALALIGVLGLTACESDADKVHRLEGDAAVTRARELRYVEQGAPPESILAAHTRRVLAERDLAKFMAGR